MAMASSRARREFPSPCSSTSGSYTLLMTPPNHTTLVIDASSFRRAGVKRRGCEHGRGRSNGRSRPGPQWRGDDPLDRAVPRHWYGQELFPALHRLLRVSQCEPIPANPENLPRASGTEQWNHNRTWNGIGWRWSQTNRLACVLVIRGTMSVCHGSERQCQVTLSPCRTRTLTPLARPERSRRLRPVLSRAKQTSVGQVCGVDGARCVRGDPYAVIPGRVPCRPALSGVWHRRTGQL